MRDRPSKMGLEQTMVITVGKVVSVNECLRLKTSWHLFPTAARSHPAARSIFVRAQTRNLSQKICFELRVLDDGGFRQAFSKRE
jgi:hypothetical protein